MGASGSGKSTILNIIGLLDKATSGDVILFGQKNIRPFSMKAEQMLKNKIGYLFQNFALIENETVANNLKLALENVRGNKKEKISAALKEVGLEGYENKKIFKCSGGEQQRAGKLLKNPGNIKNRNQRDPRYYITRQSTTADGKNADNLCI